MLTIDQIPLKAVVKMHFSALFSHSFSKFSAVQTICCFLPLSSIIHYSITSSFPSKLPVSNSLLYIFLRIFTLYSLWLNAKGAFVSRSIFSNFVILCVQCAPTLFVWFFTSFSGNQIFILTDRIFYLLCLDLLY